MGARNSDGGVDRADTDRSSKGLTDNGYTLVAQRCDFQAYGGVFANAAGDSLRVGVGFNSGGAEFEAKIGLDHERLTVDEFPFIDRYDGTDCWPTP